MLGPGWVEYLTLVSVSASRRVSRSSHVTDWMPVRRQESVEAGSLNVGSSGGRL